MGMEREDIMDILEDHNNSIIIEQLKSDLIKMIMCPRMIIGSVGV